MTTNTPKNPANFNGKNKPTFHIRKEAIREGELLYDRKGLIVAIKRKGQLLAVLRGEE